MILGDENELDNESLKYVIDNRVDMIIVINLPGASLERSLRKMDLTRYGEKPLANIKPVKSIDFRRRKVDFSLNVRINETFLNIKSYYNTNIYLNMKTSRLAFEPSTGNELEYSLTLASIDRIELKSSNSGTSSSKQDHSRESVEVVSSTVLSLFNDPESFQERILILSK